MQEKKLCKCGELIDADRKEKECPKCWRERMLGVAIDPSGCRKESKKNYTIK